MVAGWSGELKFAVVSYDGGIWVGLFWGEAGDQGGVGEGKEATSEAAQEGDGEVAGVEDVGSLEVIEQGGACYDVQEGNGESQKGTEDGVEDEGILGTEAVEEGDEETA